MNLQKLSCRLVAGIVLMTATPLFSSVLEDIKGQAVQYRQEGYSLEQQHRLEEAAAMYRKAVYLDPQYAPAYNDMGILYAKTGDDVRAEETFLSAIEVDPEYGPPYSNLALLYEKRGEYGQALQYLRTFVVKRYGAAFSTYSR